MIMIQVFLCPQYGTIFVTFTHNSQVHHHHNIQGHYILFYYNIQSHHVLVPIFEVTITEPACRSYPMPQMMKGSSPDLGVFRLISLNARTRLSSRGAEAESSLALPQSNELSDESAMLMSHNGHWSMFMGLLVREGDSTDIIVKEIGLI